jgi:hypothetical protein
MILAFEVREKKNTRKWSSMKTQKRCMMRTKDKNFGGEE